MPRLGPSERDVDFHDRYRARRDAQARVPDATVALRKCADLMSAEVTPGLANEARGHARHERQRLADLILTAYGPWDDGAA